MIDITVDMAELKRRLAALPAAIQKKVMKGAVASSAAVFREQAILYAPMYTGDVQLGHPPPGTLKKSLYQFRIPEESHGTRESWRVSVRRGKKAKDGVDAYYASWVEYGTVKMAARPYMRPAFETKKSEAVEVMRQYMADHMPEAIEATR